MCPMRVFVENRDTLGVVRGRGVLFPQIYDHFFSLGYYKRPLRYDLYSLHPISTLTVTFYSHLQSL